MTQSIIERDIELIQHLDFEFAPPCENTKGCGKGAAWKFVLACCGGTILLCEACKNLELKVIADHPMVTFKCALCKKKVMLKDHIFSMERL